MWKKVALLALTAASIQLTLLASNGRAYEYADTPTEPADGVFIPKQLTLLEDIPYYVIPNALLNKPQGSFAPQTVQAIEAEVHWATTGNWWKIHTNVGDRWIKTAPWQIEVPPPTTIQLMEDTPLYGKASETGGSTGALSPQEVTVVDAEKNWFRQTEDSYNPQHWIKIHTTWLGDQWIHLRLSQIGRLQPLDRNVYYQSTYYNDSPNVDYINLHYDGYLSQLFVHQTAQFRSILTNMYQFETDTGPKWSFAAGMPIEADHRMLKRSAPSPLFTEPDAGTEISTVLPAGDLQVFEKTFNEVGIGEKEEWFHVQNGQTAGWFSPTYADPEVTADDTASIHLNGSSTSIYRFPNTRLPLNNGQIGPQTIHPLAAWTAPNGTRWYKIDSFVGQGWIQLLPYNHDRIVLKGRDNDMQIQAGMSYKGVFYQKDAGDFLYNSEPIGKLINNEPAFRTDFLADRYDYEVSGPDPSGWWTFENQDGYAFKLKTGEHEALTLWKGKPANHIPLETAPTNDTSEKQAPPLLNLTSMRTLLGAATTYNAKVAYGDANVELAAPTYDISGFTLPDKVDGNELHLSGLLYMDAFMSENLLTEKLEISLANRDKEDDAAAPRVADVKRLYSLGYGVDLHDISMSYPLKPGVNHLRIAFKVGERIVLQRDWDVTAPHTVQP
ncbi:hypothetical protein [Paenibacillus whitsoniae]|uniref:Uncharacterized protein n=1 Tax=Paenibacillus whitsoniae TaxID=2496558 RepID=A0A3S0AP94_9BACL|nr:hypothetical protein [Paenibacillus whitsoniae]RTE09138.1 hypothetical protein EJQ19_13855 [Paenibacillus whitsoniae]